MPALATEFRGLVRAIGFGGGRPLVLVGYDMGHEPEFLTWFCDRAMDQTQPLTASKIQTPVVAVGGDHALAERVRQGVELFAEHVSGGTVADCGHFVPEEYPDEIVRHVLAFTSPQDQLRPAIIPPASGVTVTEAAPRTTLVGRGRPTANTAGERQ